mgnify:CR=1 FL=1
MTNNLLSLSDSHVQELINKKSLKIAVIGIGRIGLPTALCFAKADFETIGVDINEKLVNKKNSTRKAKFVCSLTIQINKKKSFSSRGEIFGTISKKIKGKKGFGFDPIFIPNGYNITFGQMPHKKKILMDHRYVAFEKLKKKVKTL